MSDSTVYAIASGKGGVGKTTTTVNLGTALARAGTRVAVVDADLGMANLAGFVSLTPESTTLHDVLAGDADVEAATYQLAENIFAVPSGTRLDEYAETSPEGLREVVDTLRDRFDVIVLDVGAGVSHETVLPLGLADETVLVTTPEPAAVNDATKTIDLVDRAGGEVAGLVVTRTRPDGPASPTELAANLDLSLLAAVPEDDAVRESVYAGTPLVVHAPTSPAARAYVELAGDLADVEVPTPSDDASGSDDAPGDGPTGADPGTPNGVATHDEVSSAITEAESDSS